MTCRWAPESADRFVDGEMTPADASAFAHHLVACDACTVHVQELRTLLAAARSLPRTADPPPQLWDGIAEQLAPRDRPRAWWEQRRMLAAAAALLIVSSSAVTALLLRRPDPSSAGTGSAAWAVTAPPAEREYLRAAADLTEAFHRTQGALDPALVRRLVRLLAEIDGAIAEARAALRHDPDNEGLRGLLFAAHRRKLDLLDQATRLPARS